MDLLLRSALPLSVNLKRYATKAATHIKFLLLRSALPLSVNLNRYVTEVATHIKGGPEPLEKEIHEILGSKREDRFSDPFFDGVQRTSLVRFSYLLRLCNFCKAPRDMRKFPQK